MARSLRVRERRSRQPRLSIVVPALNEARNLAAVLPTLPPAHEVILVDGGSVDGTVETAQATLPGIRVVRQLRRGKGNAMAAGFAQVTGDIVVMFDADGSADPAEIPAFVDALVGGADFAKGSRFCPGGGSTRHHADPQRRQQVPQHRHERVLPDPVHRPLLRLQRVLGRHDPAPRPARPRARGAPRGRHAVGRRVRDRDAHQLPLRRGRRDDRRGARASSATGSTAGATCERSRTACGCCARSAPSTQGHVPGSSTTPRASTTALAS